MESLMRNVMIVTAAVIALAGVVFVKGYTRAAQSPQTGVSAFDLMSTAKDLPVAPPPEAF